MINIDQNELKSYIASSRACSVSGKGFSLDNEKSTVHFKFDQHKPKKFIISILRGRGSDGKVIVNNQEFLLQPNKPKAIDLSGSEISVSRPKGAYGEIYVTGIVLDEESKEDNVVMQVDWNDFLKRIGRVKGIKRTDIGIMAAEYAEILNGNEIVQMQTDPPAAFKRVGGKIVFIHPCRIFEVKMKGDTPPPDPKIPFFMKPLSDDDALDNPALPLPLPLPLPVARQTKVSPVPTIPIKQKKQPATDIAQPSPIAVTISQNEIFNSNILRASNVGESSGIGQAESGILVKNTGRFVIPVSSIKPKTTYVVSIRGKKISGNGKIGIQLINSKKVKSNMIVSLKSAEVNININLYSGDRSGFSVPYNLVVFRPQQSATGDVLIQQIKVYETNTVPNQPNKSINVVSQASLLSSSITMPQLFVENFDWNNVNVNNKPWQSIIPCFVNTDYNDKIASILVTSYNRPNLLRYGLSSIHKQNFNRDAVEVIVLNDYLPDETESVCKEFSDLNIKYIYTGQRNITKKISRTPSYALNIGAKIAKGKYLFITCAEMYHLGDTIQHMIDKLSKEKYIVTTCQGLEDSGRVLKSLDLKQKINPEKEKELLGMHLPYFLGLHKDVYFEISGYDEDFIGLAADDNDFADRLVKHGCKYVSMEDTIIHLYHSRLLHNGSALDRQHNNKENEKRLSFNRKLYAERKDKIIRNENGWGRVNIVNRQNQWHLNNIPKVVHFYWGGDKMPFMRYLTIKSFMKHNPDWEVKLHKPVVLGSAVPTWKSQEQKQSIETHKVSVNYYSEACKLGVEIVDHDFTEYGVDNSLHEVHKSDFLRWKLLSIEGGVWSDMDIIFTRPMNHMIDNTLSNASINVGLCRYDEGSHAIGFLMSSANNVFYKKVFELSKKCFNKGNYQSIGSTMMFRHFRDERRIKKINSNINTLFMDPRSVYSITNIEEFLSVSNNIEDYINAIGFHWYGGHPETSKIEAVINQDNYMEFKNFLGKLVLYTIGAK